MSRKLRNFESRNESEKEWMLDNTWCDSCGEANLGMIESIEYEEAGVVFVEGKCLGLHAPCR